MRTEHKSDPSLAEELPYWDFFDSPKPHLALNDGSLVTGIKVTPKDIECFSDHDVNHFTIKLRSLLNSIPEGVTVQFYMSVSSNFNQMVQLHHGTRTENIHPLVKKISDFREQKLRESIEKEELYLPELLIFLRTPLAINQKTKFFKKEEIFSKNVEAFYQETLEGLLQNIELLKSNLTSLGLKCFELNKIELIERVYTFLNPKRARSEPTPQIHYDSLDNFKSEELEDENWLASSSPREQMVFGDLVLESNQFILDSYYHRVITLKTLPEITYAGQLFNFLRMPFHYDLLLSFEVPPQESELSKLKQKRKMAHSMAITSGNRASDLESETKLSSTEELIRELLTTGQRIYKAQLTIVLKAEVNPQGIKTLNRQVHEVLSRFRALQGAEGLEETIGAWKILKGSLPLAPINLERAPKVKTNNLADFIPIYGPRMGDQDPVVIFRNRLNGLVSFNPFDPNLSNYNSLVTGSSGAGKSFLNNAILSQELARDLKVFIIDIGGSYKKLTEALNGQYLELNLSEQYRLNPFHLADPFQEPSNQKIKSLLAIIELMVSEDEKSKLLKLDRALLEKAIIELYKTKRIKGEVPNLSDLMRYLSAFEEASMKAISKMLYPWTGERPYGRLLDGNGSFRTDATICTFDLKGLSNYPDLQSVMVLILTDFILNQVENDKVNKKRIILDEAWELLKSNSAANFMEYCARTLRKTNSGITFITQGIEEIVTSPIGAAILNNTATKFIMLQRGDSEILKNTLKLNPQELNLIFSLEQKKGEFSEGFMIEGDQRQVVRIYPSPFEYWLSTSDANDNRYLNELMSSGLTLVEAIEKASLAYPHGFTQIPKEAM